MFKITWDDPDVVQNMTNVSPWQVQYVSLPEHSKVPGANKCYISVDSGFPLHRDGELTRGKCKISEDMGLLPEGDREVFLVKGSQGARPDQI